MKSFFVLASLAACAFAQRLHIAAPTTSQILKSGQWFTLELQQDVSLPSRFHAEFYLTIPRNSNRRARSSRPPYSSL